jgi:hypothetical protein
MGVEQHHFQSNASAFYTQNASAFSANNQREFFGSEVSYNTSGKV